MIMTSSHLNLNIPCKPACPKLADHSALADLIITQICPVHLEYTPCLFKQQTFRIGRKEGEGWDRRGFCVNIAIATGYYFQREYLASQKVVLIFVETMHPYRQPRRTKQLTVYLIEGRLDFQRKTPSAQTSLHVRKELHDLAWQVYCQFIAKFMAPRLGR